MNKHKANKPKKSGRLGLRHNIRPTLLLLIIPLTIGAITTAIIFTGLYYTKLADFGSKRLVTQNWEAANSSLTQGQPDYERRFAYYKVKDGQTAQSIAEYFSVDVNKLISLNPGSIIAGTTIKVPPIENKYQPVPVTSGTIGQAVITENGGTIYINQKYSARQPISTNLPELAMALAKYQAIEQTGPMSYRINKSILLENDIRLDITSATVNKIELRSQPNNITCLCFEQSSVLIQGVEITTYDPATKKPDTSAEDGRSFVRMKNGRMDIMDSTLAYLGNGTGHLDELDEESKDISEGGVYGVSWRTSLGQLGIELTTGWIENTTFDHNYFGGYTFGTSGMVFRGNQFTNSDVYGLDPHDDSNNALIENNLFKDNGRHGFIVSKRCNYNIIRNNVSINNKLHGYMLHKDSAYNVIENNTAYGNTDNFVVYESNFNTIRNNKSYVPTSSHVRIDKPSSNNYIQDNIFYGGNRGIYLKDGVKNTLVSSNTMQKVRKALHTQNAQNTVYVYNTIESLHFELDRSDRIIFGPNKVQKQRAELPTSEQFAAPFSNNR